MGGRKAGKNCSSAPCFTYHERQLLKDQGTAKARVGQDSQLEFGQCALCLHPAEAAVATPSGCIYCRECIMGYMLTATEKIRLQREAFEAQEQADAAAQLEAELGRRDTDIDTFRRSHDLPTNVGANSDDAAKRKAIIAQLSKRVDDSSRDVKRQRMLVTSPWIVDNTPDAGKERVAEPLARPASPMSGQPLRVKDLTPLVFTREVGPDGGSGGGSSGAGAAGAAAGAAAVAGSSAPEPVVCAVSRRQITSQRAIAIKKGGQVMLEESAKKFAYDTMTCPITGNKFKMKDVIELKRAGTGFAASGQSETSKYRPTMT